MCDTLDHAVPVRTHTPRRASPFPSALQVLLLSQPSPPAQQESVFWDGDWPIKAQQGKPSTVKMIQEHEHADSVKRTPHRAP